MLVPHGHDRGGSRQPLQRVSRDDQDAFAAESQRRADARMQDGSFKTEIVPVTITQRRRAPVTIDASTNIHVPGRRSKSSPR